MPVAGLSWRQVAILRAYRQYRQVMGGGFTKRYVNDAFVRNRRLARKLMRLFELRLDPAAEGSDERADAVALELESGGWTRSRASTTTASCAASWA